MHSPSLRRDFMCTHAAYDIYCKTYVGNGQRTGINSQKLDKVQGWLETEPSTVLFCDPFAGLSCADSTGADMVDYNLLAGRSRTCRAMLCPSLPSNARMHNARDLMWLMHGAFKASYDTMTNEPRNQVFWRRLSILFCTIRPCATYGRLFR